MFGSSCSHILGEVMFVAKLDIYSGLLGTGKTTLIKQMLSTAYKDSKVAVIENEVGKVNLDAEELNGASISVKEISSGCICCTLKGSFTEAVKMLVEQEHPDYIVVEPSGVADVSGVIKACLDSEYVTLNRAIMVVNAKKLQRLLKVIGNFFLDQLRNAWTVYLNFADELTSDQIKEVKNALWEINQELTVVAVPLSKITMETFPEGIGPLEKFREKSDMDLSIINGSERKSSAIKIRSGRSNDMNSWSYKFKDSFDEERIERLMEIFQQEQCVDIWRVKGYLRMCDGTIKKVDVSFGDQFMESIESFPESKTNLLVIIGRKINILWLKKQFEELQS